MWQILHRSFNTIIAYLAYHHKWHTKTCFCAKPCLGDQHQTGWFGCFCEGELVHVSFQPSGTALDFHCSRSGSSSEPSSHSWASTPHPTALVVWLFCQSPKFPFIPTVCLFDSLFLLFKCRSISPALSMGTRSYPGEIILLQLLLPAGKRDNSPVFQPLYSPKALSYERQAFIPLTSKTALSPRNIIPVMLADCWLCMFWDIKWPYKNQLQFKSCLHAATCPQVAIPHNCHNSCQAVT